MKLKNIDQIKNHLLDKLNKIKIENTKKILKIIKSNYYKLC